MRSEWRNYMSTPIRDNRVRAVWRIGITLALLLGIPRPCLERLTGPGSTRDFARDRGCRSRRDGALPGVRPRPGRRQWQQTGTLLERIGLPNAPERWVDALLEIGARKGNFTEADLNALLGGELALVVTPVAVERAMEHHERHQQQGDAPRHPWLTPGTNRLV